MPFNSIRGLVPKRIKVVSPHALIVKVSGNVDEGEVESKMRAFTKYVGAKYLDDRGRLCFNVRVRNPEAQRILLPQALMNALPKDPSIRITATRLVL